MGTQGSREEKQYLHNVYIHADMAEIVFPTSDQKTYSHQLYLCIKDGHSTYEGLLELVIGCVGLDRSKIVDMPWVVWVSKKIPITTDDGEKIVERLYHINNATQHKVIANYIINPSWDFHFKLCPKGSTGLYEENTLNQILTKKGVY